VGQVVDDPPDWGSGRDQIRDQIRDQDAAGQRRTGETHATSTVWRVQRMVTGETDQAL
jgi:hypothetical protein